MLSRMVPNFSRFSCFCCQKRRDGDRKIAVQGLNVLCNSQRVILQHAPSKVNGLDKSTTQKDLSEYSKMESGRHSLTTSEQHFLDRFRLTPRLSPSSEDLLYPKTFRPHVSLPAVQAKTTAINSKRSVSLPVRFTVEDHFVRPQNTTPKRLSVESWPNKVSTADIGCFGDMQRRAASMSSTSLQEEIRVVYALPKKRPGVKLVHPHSFKFKRNDCGEIITIGQGSTSQVFLGELTLKSGDIKPVCLKYYTKRGNGDAEREFVVYRHLYQTGYVPFVYGLLYIRDKNNRKSFALLVDFFPGSKSVCNLMEEEAVCHPLFWIRVIMKITEALRKIHELGVLINDVKWDNVLIDMHTSRNYDPKILLIDFGCASDHRGMVHRYTSPSERWKYEHIAPEALNGSRTSIASDIYSLGVLINDLAACAVVNRGQEILDLIFKLAQLATYTDSEDRISLLRLEKWLSLIESKILDGHLTGEHLIQQSVQLEDSYEFQS